MRRRNPYFTAPSSILFSLFVLFGLLSLHSPASAEKHGFVPVQKLLDLSGLVWLEDDTFLAVHDAKFPGEDTLARVSLLVLPHSLAGLQWKPLRPDFPKRPSSDLESASRVPGTRDVLLVESGDDGSSRDGIYLARVRGHDVHIVDATQWSSFAKAYNVEATAVARTGNGLLFIWAERAQGKSSTSIRWTDLTIEPFRIGQSKQGGQTEFALPKELAVRYNRPLVGLDVSPDGVIYGVAAMDSDFDDGPWRSAVMRIGALAGTGVRLDAEPTVIGFIDGLKIESVALRPGKRGVEVFFGTDDENYGGTLRQMFLDKQ